MEQEAALDLGGEFPVFVPYFMKEIIEQISVSARKIEVRRSRQRRQRPLQHRQLPHDGRQRPASRRAAGREAGRAAHQRPRPPAHVVARQARTRPDGFASDERAAGARRRSSPRRFATVFEEYVDEHGLDEIADVFGKGVKIEVGDMLPSVRVRQAAQARAEGVGEGVRGQRRRLRRGCGRAASSSCWPGSTPPTRSAAAPATGGSPTRREANDGNRRPLRDSG